MFRKEDHKHCFAYEAHTACNEHGFVPDTVVTAGSVQESVAFHPLYDRLTANFPRIHAIFADSAYKTPYICKRIFDDGRVLSTAYKHPQTLKDGHEWYKYLYDEYYDCIICPEYHILHHSTASREGYREYKSRSYICKNCPAIHRCTPSRNCEKVVTLHVWNDYIELTEDARYTPYYKALYKKRKEKHAMRYTPFRGLTQVANWVRLKFAAMNLKTPARWLAKFRLSFSFPSL